MTENMAQTLQWLRVNNFIAQPEQIEFEILDHGCDGEQYFPGCGVSFTRWTDIVTGIGNSAREAAEDAFEQMAMTVDITTELPVAALADAIRELPDTLTVTEDDSEEWHHYVSIRWRVLRGADNER